MAERPKPASLDDLINYRADDYFTQDEAQLIRSLFGGVTGEKALKVLRKALIPTITDPELPREQIGNDAWMSGIDFASMPAEEVKPIVLARQNALKFIIGGLVQLKVMANTKPETSQQAADRAAKNSSR